jgi:hypothetical protein
MPNDSFDAVYETPDGEMRVDVRLERETVWLPLTQMAELFDRYKSLISRHLANTFCSGELVREATGADHANGSARGRFAWWCPTDLRVWPGPAAYQTLCTPSVVARSEWPNGRFGGGPSSGRLATPEGILKPAEESP